MEISMSGKTHTYTAHIKWTGNEGTGTSAYTAYNRNHTIGAEGKPAILGSSDPAFRGDGTRYNPEDMLVASLSTCHMLWYLHVAATAGVVVTAYEDKPVGTMAEDTAKGGYFTSVVLHPRVTITPNSDAAEAQALHGKAHHFCFIANSVNFPVTIEPEVIVA
jgi:organic hydroperoxide reductase OsmC/OhrA